MEYVDVLCPADAGSEREIDFPGCAPNPALKSISNADHIFRCAGAGPLAPDARWRKKRLHRLAVLAVLQVAGYKHAPAITAAVFDLLRSSPSLAAGVSRPADALLTCAPSVGPMPTRLASASCAPGSAIPYDAFVATILQALREFGFGRARDELYVRIALRLRERRQSITLLLGGTSGCGKSTLASLVGSRLAISTVLSTDNIRHLLRHFYPKEKMPVLWTSSYYAGTVVDPAASNGNGDGCSPDGHPESSVIRGFEAQNDCIFEKIDEIITKFERRNESLVLEGVHLSVRNILKLLEKHPSCIPFIIYISNQSKHSERFAVRARYMTLEPRENKYIKYFDNIRTIQDHVVCHADKALIPKIDNTNVDRSLSTLHKTIIETLTRQEETSQNIFDPKTGTTDVLFDEYLKVCNESWSSKAMLEQIGIARRLPSDLQDVDVEDMNEDALRFNSLGS